MTQPNQPPPPPNHGQVLHGRGSLSCGGESEVGGEGGGESGGDGAARCALGPRDLLELGPDAHRAGASYTLEASERLIVLLFRQRKADAHAE